ncbi:MAG: OmpH family outer membrane protein [Akkermansiaceae bacterium]
MKNYLKLSITFITGALLLASASAQNLKIATVDVESLFNDYYRTAIEQQVIVEEYARISDDNAKRMVDIRAMEEQLLTLRKKLEDPTIADNVKKDSSKEFQMKLDELKTMDQERMEFKSRHEKALELQKRSSIESIRGEITEEIVKYSKNEAYDYVMDKSGVSQNQVPFLIYSKDAADITAAIIDILNANAPETEEAPSE